jgi:hypothetical protein
VPGRGKAGHGHPREDRTGPLEEFLVDNQVFYKHVREHLSQCSLCNPRAVLEIYLERRRTEPKFKGVAAQTFVKNAVAYIRLCKKRSVPAPLDLIAEAIGRGLDPQELVEHEETLGVENTARTLLVMRQVLVKSQFMGPNYTRLEHLVLKGGRPFSGVYCSWLVPLVDDIYDHGGQLPPAADLEDLGKVAEVMLS